MGGSPEPERDVREHRDDHDGGDQGEERGNRLHRDVQEGLLAHGRGGDEGRIGKIPVRSLNGSGKVLTVNRVASGRAILERVVEAVRVRASGSTGTARRPTAAVQTSNVEDGPERRCLSQGGTSLCEALILLTTAFLPETIVLAGPVSQVEAFVAASSTGSAEPPRARTRQPSSSTSTEPPASKPPSGWRCHRDDTPGPRCGEPRRRAPCQRLDTFRHTISIPTARRSRSARPEFATISSASGA